MWDSSDLTLNGDERPFKVDADWMSLDYLTINGLFQGLEWKSSKQG